MSYYAPSTEQGINRYCEVEGSGEFDKSGEDKVSCTHIKIGAEIGLNGLIKAGLKFILDKVNWKDNKESNTGYCSAAVVEGKESIAIVTGKESKAKGALGCWIILTERGKWNGETYPIIEVKAFKVDGDEIKADTFYTLVNG